ncbi:MAG: large conductance mechanosensitive channel protein MscL, partial [Bacteroidia bacterium]
VIPGTAIKYGNFISQIISFLLVAFALFLVIKGINASKKKEAVVEPPKGPTQEELLTEIRDLLKK